VGKKREFRISEESLSGRGLGKKGISEFTERGAGEGGKELDWVAFYLGFRRATRRKRGGIPSEANGKRWGMSHGWREHFIRTRLKDAEREGPQMGKKGGLCRD